MARGSVRQAKDGTWHVRYDAGLKENGDRDQRYKGGFTGQQEADAYLIRCLHEVQTGRHSKRTRQTFGDYAAEWLSLQTTRPNTQAANRAGVRILLPHFGAVALSSLTARHVQKALSTLRETYAQSTIRRVAGTARAICRAAVRDAILAPAVLDGIRVSPFEPREHRILAPTELVSFLTAVVDDPEAALWQVYARTGLRRGEALGLYWDDLDLARRRLSVRRQVIQTGSELPRLAPPKTRRSTRTIAIDRTLVQALTAHREAQRRAYLAAGVGKPKPDLVFPRTPGVPFTPVTISKRCQRLMGRLGLEGTRLHDLRHTRATAMLREGLNPRMVADYLGHDVAMLLRVYAHAMPADQDAAVERLAALLDDATCPQSSDLAE